MPENGTSGSMSGDGKRSVAAWPKLPRPSSTLPKAATERTAVDCPKGAIPVIAAIRRTGLWKVAPRSTGSGMAGVHRVAPAGST
jgi:hypothetical protein